MFMKKVMVAMMSSALLIGTLPVEAATFGKSSSTSTRSSTFSSGSTSRSSSFSSPSSSRSTSTYSSSTSTSRGGISQGSSIGMSRSNVANSVKNGTYSAPSNGATVAGSNPGGYNNSSSYSNNRNYNNGNYNNGSYNGGGYNNGGYNNNYPQQQGHSTGALVGAAAVAGVAGYALGSHNNSNNHGTTVVVPNGGAPVVAGNGAPVVAGNGAPVVVDNNGNYTTTPIAGAPVVVAPQQSVGSGIASFIWTLIKIIVGLAILYFIVRLIMNFFSRRNTGSTIGSSFGSTPVFNTKTPEDEIRDMKENFFVQFQQNNRPSGLNHIRQNSTPVFYNAVEDMVREQSDTRSVKVRQLEAELVDLTQDGSRYVASVRYHAVVAEGDNGNMQDSEVKELWNFVYENNTWKLAGIDQL